MRKTVPIVSGFNNQFTPVITCPKWPRGLWFGSWFAIIASTSMTYVTILADEKVREDPPSEIHDKHGAPQFLVENLIRVREQERLLSNVRVEADGRFTSESIEALQQIFAYPSDVFRIDPQSSTPSGIRQQALQKLLTANRTAQQQWMESTTVLAESRLRQALVSGDRSAIAEVSREFPLSEAGTRANVLTLTADFLSGRQRDVEVRLQRMLTDYSGTIHEKYVVNVSQSLLKNIRSKQIESHSADPDSGILGDHIPTELSLPTSQKEGSLSPPWPEASWTWTEDVWNFPGVPQPEAGNTLESMIPGTTQSMNDFRNWRPLLWNECLILRTPFRVIAFDKENGRQKWSIPTQTFVRDENINNSHEDSESRAFNGTGNEPGVFNGLASFGLMSSDDQYLYLVDSFDFFSTDADPVDESIRPRQRLRLGLPQIDSQAMVSRRKATCIVAIQKVASGTLPRVAWVAGEPTSFDYQPVSAIARENSRRFGRPARPSASASSNVIQNESSSVRQNQFPPSTTTQNDSSVAQLAGATLQGHRFHSPPVGVDELLYVPSTFRDVQWLNCLRRGTGDIVWQQPLAFSDEVISQYQDISNPVRSNSGCLLAGNSVICWLSSGILVSVRATDGELQWATAIREEEPVRQLGGLRWPNNDDDDQRIDSPCVLMPMAGTHVIVCTDHNSGKLHGISIENGEILWRTSRHAFGPGDTGGSPDLYIAGLAGNHAIMIGERHCRSIDLRTGDQNWVVSITRTSGRADCRGNQCLIPQADGQVISVSTENGAVVRQRQAFLPSGATPTWGALLSDDSSVYVATPVSMAAFPRSDFLSKTIPVPISLTRENSSAAMKRIQALLINGDDQLAIEALRSAANSVATDGGDAKGRSNDELRSEFEQQLGELILQDWSARVIPALRSSDNSNLPLMISPEHFSLLASLDLSTEQQVRAAALTLLNHPKNGPSLSDLQELRDLPEWHSVVEISEGWSVRPDLLFETAGAQPETGIAETPSISIPKRRQIAANMALFPRTVRSEEECAKCVEQLMASGDYSAAECVAIGFLSRSDSPRMDDVLTGLRQGVIDREGRRQSRATTPADLIGLTSKNAVNASIESSVSLSSTDWNMQRVERGLWISNLPVWVQPRFFLVDGKGNMPELVSIDMADGSLRDQIPLPFAFHRNTIGFRAISNSKATPGLIPFAGAEQIAMVSCVVPESAKVLWTRRLLNSDSETSGIEFGQIGSNYFLWHHKDELHCSNPLNGVDLWNRKLRLSPATHPIPGVQRIFGDQNTTIVMGTDLSSFERFSTRDGRSLGSGRLSIGRISDAVTVGRCLLYPDINSRLHLFDGATGLDALDESTPIILGQNNPDSMFQVLSDGRVVMVTANFEIILIDTNSCKVVFRTSVAQHIKTGAIFGLTAFERNDRLFVGLDEQREFSARTLEASFRLRDPRLQGGPLFCMAPQTGSVHWTMTVHQTAIPEIYGAATDVMVMWSQPPFNELQPNERRPSTIKIQLVDVASGKILASEPSILSSRPLRCIHRADQNQIDVIARDALISIKAKPEN